MNEKEIYEQNEISANKSMAFVSLVMAGILFVFWILCMFGVNVFSFTASTAKYVKISTPIDILFLITPICFIKTDKLKKPGFKYFVITLFICVVGAINMVLPKDGIMLWAATIAVAALYFNPKVTKFAFILSAAMMLVVAPLGVIYGSWESNIMGVNDTDFFEVWGFDPDSRKDRIYWLTHFKEITHYQDSNRWVALFVFYFLPRLLTLVVIFQLANSLSKRTKFVLEEQAAEAKSIQKMSSELNIASAIQSSCLPAEFPDSSRLELFAMMDPAKEVGGDFYDFFKIDDDHCGLVIGDVSGKGVPASLYMMKTQAVIKALTTSIKNDPALILEKANVALCEGNDMNMFVTCWLGILDLNNGELSFSSAGHNPPVLKKQGNYEFLKTKNGLVLGGFSGAKYLSETIKLDKGDQLLLYTDGVTEAHNTKEELYGESRLLNFLNNNQPSPVEGIVKIRESLKSFADGAEQFDDITMLMIEYHKPQSVFAKKFLAVKDNLSKVQDFVIGSVKGVELSEKDKNMLNIAIEEIFINIASYSFDEYGRVDVGVNSENGTMTLIFMDNGKPFDPLKKEDPNIDAKAQDRSIGGLGIYMVKNIMDKVYYEYKDGKNILTLVKKYSQD